MPGHAVEGKPNGAGKLETPADWEVTSPAPRPAWQALVAVDPTSFVYQTPAGLDALWVTEPRTPAASTSSRTGSGPFPPLPSFITGDQPDLGIERLGAVLDHHLGIGYQIAIPARVLGGATLGCHQGVVAIVLHPHEGDLADLSRLVASHCDDDNRDTGVPQGVGPGSPRGLLLGHLLGHPIPCARLVVPGDRHTATLVRRDGARRPEFGLRPNVAEI